VHARNNSEADIERGYKKRDVTEASKNGWGGVANVSRGGGHWLSLYYEVRVAGYRAKWWKGDTKQEIIKKVTD